MNRRKYSKVIKLSLVCSILALFAVIAWFNLRGNQTPQALSERPTYHCNYSDTSFCPIEFIYSRYVSENDSSDLLDNQTPVKTTCRGAAQKQPYCKGVAVTLTINLFQIITNSKPSLYSRNEYIAYFNQYFAEYGPFKESKIETSGNGAAIVFVGKHNGNTLSLLFNKVSGAGWKFAWPTTGT